MAGRKSITTLPFNPNEEWRPVVGFEDEYEVSNFGNVRRAGTKRARSTYAGRPLTPNPGKSGYYTVALRGSTTLVHRLVAQAFLKSDAKRPEVNHKNGVRSDNRVENLEYVSHAENMAHAAGVLKKGGTRKLTEDGVRNLRARYARGGITQEALADELGMNEEHIRKVINGTWWKHVV